MQTSPCPSWPCAPALSGKAPRARNEGCSNGRGCCRISRNEWSVRVVGRRTPERPAKSERCLTYETYAEGRRRQCRDPSHTASRSEVTVVTVHAREMRTAVVSNITVWLNVRSVGRNGGQRRVVKVNSCTADLIPVPMHGERPAGERLVACSLDDPCATHFRRGSYGGMPAG